MPDLKTIHTAISTLPSGPPLVVAVVGGTTGIGSYIVRALARTFSSYGSKLRVYIIGRRASSAETLIKFAAQTCPGSDFRFIQASDLALLSDVVRVAQEIDACEHADPWAGGPPRLDVLYMTQALSPLAPSNRTYFPVFPVELD
jgi:NAD(P)-dependent dehydrogenase (short-subunit alcohol dehydrogenase family)